MPSKPLPPALLAALRDYAAPRMGKRSLLWMGQPDNHDWPSEPTLHRAAQGKPISDASRALIEAGLRKHAPDMIGGEKGPDIIHVLRRKAREEGFGELTDEQLLRVHRAIEPLLAAQFSFVAKP